MIATTQPLLLAKIEPAVFEAVSEALHSNQWREVDYQNASGQRVRLSFRTDAANAFQLQETPLPEDQQVC